MGVWGVEQNQTTKKTTPPPPKKKKSFPEFSVLCSGHQIMLLNTLEKEYILSVQERGLLFAHSCFLLQQPLLLNYPLTQLFNCLTVFKSWTSTYCSLMFYFTILLVCLDVNTSKDLALQILYQTCFSIHNILNLIQLFILIPCHRNACSIFHESFLAKFFTSAKSMFSVFIPTLYCRRYLDSILPLK